MRVSRIVDKMEVLENLPVSMMIDTQEYDEIKSFEISDTELITRYLSNPEAKSIWITTDNLDKNFDDLAKFLVAIRNTYNVKDMVWIMSVNPSEEREKWQRLMRFGNVIPVCVPYNKSEGEDDNK